MFKKIGILCLILVGCTFHTPTEFTQKALEDSFVTVDKESIQLKEIIQKYKGKKVLINVWASWCKDCIVSMPKLKELQKSFPEVPFVFLSTDKSVKSWKKGIDNYQLKGDHYFMKSGLDSDFGDFLNSNWIPRYLVVDENGFVKLFKATKVTDPRIVEALKK